MPEQKLVVPVCPRRESGHLWRFDRRALDYGLPGGRVPGVRVGAADFVSDGTGGAAYADPEDGGA